jgi:hypothetical protein
MTLTTGEHADAIARARNDRVTHASTPLPTPPKGLQHAQTRFVRPSASRRADTDGIARYTRDDYYDPDSERHDENDITVGKKIGAVGSSSGRFG